MFNCVKPSGSPLYMLTVPADTTWIGALQLGAEFGAVRSVDITYVKTAGVALLAYEAEPVGQGLERAPESLVDLALTHGVGKAGQPWSRGDASTAASSAGDSPRAAEDRRQEVSWDFTSEMRGVSWADIDDDHEDPWGTQSSSSQSPKKKGKRFLSSAVDLAAIEDGRDTRTTVMVKNFPNRICKERLLEYFGEFVVDKHDCCYLPTDPFRGCNMGFAFLNFTKPEHIVPFFRAFQGMRWSDTAEHRASTKVCDITYARTQGSAKVMKMCDHPAQPQPADGPRSRVEKMNRKWQMQQAVSAPWGVPVCVVPQYAQGWA